MGVPVMILGESGSGKSSSLRNFKRGEVLVLQVVNKMLPFKNNLETVKNATYTDIAKALKLNKYKSYVIDDSQYLLANELFSRAKEVGYGKFTDIAVRFKNMIDYVIKDLPDDVTVYFLHHCETTQSGKVKPKTVGQMLDNQLTVEGLFSIVLMCQTDGTKHEFITQSDGYTVAKSPIGMFDTTIENDLKMVDITIRAYMEVSENE